ncbi:YihY/virulence factor BrkB family protein [Microvirga puerhi]|uniref:YihY/virulence factor BrkB family protein n=1 Tax=Microvirga puerhi TaxID=2876078 RepID=A0ABS7VRE5_9HYPH|nr:YihY/virulence factor BrkB family protein [Microvirga puerhi]MBZ6077695.1 YihY/virulence factor BrkB family protein [Microvirga puerhi]
MNRLRLTYEVITIAANRFLLHDGWAIASHIALSVLTSMFPFLILLTALAGLFGTGTLADEAANIILEAWPREIAEPIAAEIHNILTGRRSDVLTLGLVLALYFASSGVEGLRVGLNRAYGLRETRAWWLTRLESLAFVMGGALVMLALALLVVLGPFVWRGLLFWIPALKPLDSLIGLVRIGTATVIIVVGLIVAHKLVPAGRRSVLAVLPGVGVTLLLWILGGLGFGWYLEFYPGAYASTYGGLSTAMVALIFLYTLGAIFLFGGELNGTIIAAKRGRLAEMHDYDQVEDVVKLP